MTMTTDNHVLCFDVRINGGNKHADDTFCWPEDRKQHFLYRLDVNIPISIDRNVTETIDSHFYDANTSGYTGPFSPRWENLDALRLLAKTSNINPEDYYFLPISIDISLFTERELEHWNSLLGNKSQNVSPATLFEGLASPNTVDKSWEFLGYDVADTGFTSAISNMGFTADDNLPKLRAQWGDTLNMHHLFNKTDDALRFKEFSNHRVPEHAPFFIYTLWRILET